MMIAQAEPIPALFRSAAPSLLVGAVALLACTITAFFNPPAFFRAYLFAYLCFLGIALGSMGMIMLHYLVGGAWGLIIRRPGEAGFSTLPLLAILFIPLIFGFHHLYPWANPDLVRQDLALEHRLAFFNAPFIVIRAVIYFCLWIFFAWRLRRLSLQHDRASNPLLVGRLQRYSAAGLVVYFVTMSSAAIDWIASRESHWYSSVFGLIVVVGQALSGLVFLILVLWLLPRVAQPDAIHDLGNLLLTTLILWAYMSFAQFLVQWMGNTQDDVPWYVHRSNGLWGAIVFGLIVLHFFVPFLLLLDQQVKRHIGRLAMLAVGVLVLRWIDVLWMVAPSNNGSLSWLDPIALIGIGGIWFAVFLWLLKRHPLLPLGVTVPTTSGVSHAGPPDSISAARPTT